MMPPKRRTGRDLPDNLYPSPDNRTGVVYYRWRNPATEKWHGLGTDKARAVADAKALNAVVLADMAQSRIQSIASPVPDTPKFSAVLLRHAELCELKHSRGKLAANTLKGKRSYGKAMLTKFGDRPIGEIGVRDFAAFFEEYVEAGKERAAQGFRSEAIEVYKTAMSEGWITTNVPELTRTIDVQVKRARLSLENWFKVREVARGLDPWVGLSMDLALLTAQRVEDLAKIETRPREGATAWVEGGSLWVIQSKTGNRVCIPLSLRLEAIGLSVGDVIKKTFHRHLIHHRTHSGAMAGDKVHKQRISKAFTQCVRASGIEWEAGKTAPTFHEQRSLAAREYTLQGNVDVQALLGHKDAATTAIYKDNRGSEWCFVKAG
jgi:integrase